MIGKEILLMLLLAQGASTLVVCYFLWRILLAIEGR
jgi:hypothetical protein